MSNTSGDISAFIRKLLVLTGFCIILALIYEIRDILSVFVFAGFLVVLFSPILNALNRKGISDLIGIIIIFFGLLIFFAIVLGAILPIFAEQIVALISSINHGITDLIHTYQSGGIEAFHLPGFIANYLRSFNLTTVFNFIQNNISSIGNIVTGSAQRIAESSANILSSVSGGIFQMIMVMIFTFFVALERSNIRFFLHSILPRKMTEYLISREKQISKSLSAWIRGQMLLGLSIFALTLVGLLVLKLFGIHMSNIFTLALIAGLMEFIPYIGPFIALLPALAIAGGMGFSAVIAIFILYILIQQCENNIFVPWIMSKSLNLSPFLILFIMTIGADLFGILGILLAIPVAAVLQIFVRDAIEWKKKAERGDRDEKIEKKEAKT